MNHHVFPRLLTIFGFVGLTFLFPPPARASITITSNLSPASPWPGDVTISTGDPAMNTTGVGVSPTYRTSQTFTPTTDVSLDAIYFTYATSVASSTNSYAIRIQQVSEGAAAQTYAAAADILPSGSNTFTLASTSGAARQMKFSFTGNDQVVLHQGVVYAVEISSTSSALTLYRRGADTYSGGSYYDNRQAYNYPSTRDLAMGVATSPPSAITVTEFTGSATEWPESFNVITDIPDGVTSSASVTPTSILSQTFTPGKNFNLGTIYLLYSTSATSAPNSFSVRLQTVSSSTTQTYTQGTNLLPGSPTFSLANTAGAMRLLKISFNGTYQVPLTAGTTYAFEILSTSSSAAFYRRGADTYSYGALYLNRSAFNYPSTRDIAMGVIKAGGADMGTGPIAGQTFLPIPQIFGIQMLDGNASTDAEKDQVAAGGFKYFRRGIYWSRVEQSMGNYNFSVSSYDTLFSGLMSRGLQPYITLFDGNSVWGETQRSVRSSTGRTAFANFAKAVAIHYPTARYFDIWNEPNLSFFWTPQPSLTDYCALAATVAPEIKTITPSAKVVGPALSGQHISFDWLEQAFRLGLLNSLDGITVHPYRDGNRPPETVLAEYRQLRAYIQQYCPTGKQVDIIAGEWGYHTDSTANAVTEDVQAQYAARMFLIHSSIGMPFANMYSWNDGTTDPNSNDHYGMRHTDGTIKPAYNAVKTLATTLNGYTFQQQVAQGDPSLFVMKFTNAAGKQAYAAWTTGTNAPVTITLPAGTGTLYSIYGSTQAISWNASGPQITVSTSPQYLLVD